MTSRAILPIALLAMVVASSQAHGAGVAKQPRPEQVVRAFVAAFNKHDVPAMVALADSSIVWLSVAGDSVVVETRGHAKLASGMERYFGSLPTARSEIETLSALGPWVSVRERASWTGKAGKRSQAAMSIYEVRDGLVRRVWYYPAVR